MSQQTSSTQRLCPWFGTTHRTSPASLHHIPSPVVFNAQRRHLERQPCDLALSHDQGMPSCHQTILQQ